MRNYTIYPEALEKLESSGLKKSVDDKVKVSKYDMTSPYGYYMKSDVASIFKELEEEGYFKYIPQDIKNSYKSVINSIYESKNIPWIINRIGRETQIDSSLDDVILYFGWFAKEVMGKDEMWDAKKFGFDNPLDLIACVSQYVISSLKMPSSSREGYNWTTYKNGRILISKMYGSKDHDFRAERQDVSPYETSNPFGLKASLRPVCSEDFEIISGYHSVESSFLKIILRWIDQCEIKSEMLKDNGKKLWEYLESLSGLQGFGGGCTEHLFRAGNYEHKAQMLFICYEYPICNWKSTERNFGYSVGTENHGAYSGFIDNENELVFSYSSENTKEEDMKIGLRYYPEDADEVLKALIYQCRMQLGRTSINEIVAVLEDYFKNKEKYLKGEYR